MLHNALKITLQWTLRLLLIVGLCFACYRLALMTAFDDSRRYYEEFIPIIAYASSLRIDFNRQTIVQQQFDHCIKTAKVFTYFEAVKKCTYRIQ